LSTVPINIGEELPFGTVVAPGTLAPYHQHLFSLRFDPALDGHANSLLVEESHPMVWHQDSNPLGIGYTQHGTIVENEGGLDLDHTKGRTFKIINENIVNPITGTPVGYKLLPAYSQMLLAHPESFHAKRSEFGQQSCLWMEWSGVRVNSTPLQWSLGWSGVQWSPWLESSGVQWYRPSKV
jgi:primary-amine oxidase